MMHEDALKASTIREAAIRENELSNATNWWENELTTNEKASLLRDKPWTGTQEERNEKLISWYRVFVSKPQREDDHREYLAYKREVMEMDEASAAREAAKEDD